MTRRLLLSPNGVLVHHTVTPDVLLVPIYTYQYQGKEGQCTVKFLV